MSRIIEFIDYCLLENPMLILDNFNVRLSISSIMETRNHRLGFRRKRAQIVSIARLDPRVILLRTLYRKTMRFISASRMVFVDESHFESDDLCRRFGVAKGGDVVENKTQATNGQRFSLLCGIWRSKIVYRHWLHVSEYGQMMTFVCFISFMRSLSTQCHHCLGQCQDPSNRGSICVLPNTPPARCVPFTIQPGL